MARAQTSESPSEFIPAYNDPPDMGRQVVSYKQLKMTMVPQNIVPVGDREFTGKNALENRLATEAFMQEEVVIVVQKTEDKNAEPWVPVGCNGEHVWLPRGTPISIPRKFLESLMRTTRSWTTPENPDPRSDQGYLNVPSDTLRFPFQIEHDPNPRGRAWMRRVMYQG